MAARKNKVSLVLPKATAVYPKLRKPDTEGKYATGKYQTRLSWDEWELDKVEEAVAKIAKEEWGSDVDLSDVKRPYIKPEDQTKEIFEGLYTLNTTTKFKPELVDSKKKPLPAKVDVWGGDVIKCVVTLIPYESTEKVREGKKTVTVTVYGISAQLNAVMLVEKKTGGGGASMFDEEDGYEADGFDEEEGGYEAEDDTDGLDDNDGDF